MRMGYTSFVLLLVAYEKLRSEAPSTSYRKLTILLISTKFRLNLILSVRTSTVAKSCQHQNQHKWLNTGTYVPNYVSPKIIK